MTFQECPDPPPPPTADPASSNAAGWALLGVAVVVLVVDWLLKRSGRPDMSEWSKKKLRRVRWLWRIIGVSIFGSLLWHMLFGGPF